MKKIRPLAPSLVLALTLAPAALGGVMEIDGAAQTPRPTPAASQEAGPTGEDSTTLADAALALLDSLLALF